MRKRIKALVAVAFAALMLSGCTPNAIPSSTPTPSSAAPTTSETAAPSPVVTPKQTSQPVDPIETNLPTGLPQSCDELGTATTRAATVDTLEFFPDVPVPTIIQGADVQLSCYWFAGDISGTDLVIAIVDEPDAVIVLEDAATAGFTCGGQNGYTMCRLDEPADYNGNPYTVTSFYLYGSGVWLESVASNIDTTTFIDEIAASIWQ